ncbi:MAG: GNAT family N-acetyltransferase [Anaerolineales bacterium]|nr:GNAT family N-acetyltransferase [Anaerolineales bacterium]
MKIRFPTLDDCAQIAEIQVDSYRSAYASMLPAEYLANFTYEEQEQDWRNLLSDENRDILLVAEIGNGILAGYALGCPGVILEYALESELVALHVRKSHHRQGVGQRLIAAMAAELHRHGCISMLLWTLEGNSARQMYEKLGGVLVGKKPWDGNQDFGLEVYEVAYGWPDITKLLPAEKT